MLTYSQIQKIAHILNWSVEDVEASIATLNAGFMTPHIQDFMAGDIDGHIEGDGFYHRLSAPGYLDCTEWHGPFETEEEAVADLLQTYAD